MNPLSKVNFIVVHCADTKSDKDVTVSDLHQWHVAENGWSDIGYHFFVKFNGLRFECRSTSYQGAHCKQVNDKSIAICLEGGFGGANNFTELQLDSLFELLSSLKVQHPNAAVVGHNHFDPKQCPCFDVTKWYEDKLTLENTKAFGSWL